MTVHSDTKHEARKEAINKAVNHGYGLLVPGMGTIPVTPQDQSRGPEVGQAPRPTPRWPDLPSRLLIINLSCRTQTAEAEQHRQDLRINGTVPAMRNTVMRIVGNNPFVGSEDNWKSHVVKHGHAPLNDTDVELRSESGNIDEHISSGGLQVYYRFHSNDAFLPSFKRGVERDLHILYATSAHVHHVPDVIFDVTICLRT